MSRVMCGKRSYAKNPSKVELPNLLPDIAFHHSTARLRLVSFAAHLSK